MKSMREMSILVTGGGSGIGTDCARRFCQEGARVTISGRRLEKLEAVQAELGEHCHIIQGDVTEQGDRERMVAAAVAHGGGQTRRPGQQCCEHVPAARRRLHRGLSPGGF